jgi:Mlc titration factor MtfA (ptsG expression regulator)
MLGLSDPASVTQWRSVATIAMSRLEAAGADGTPCVLDPYSLESEAELFAVATEAFIEEPEALLEEFPEIYAELQRAYGLSPADW